MFVFIQQKGPDGQPMMRLLAEGGPLQGRMLRLQPPKTRIGQASDNEIVLPLDGIAPYHAEISLASSTATLHALTPTPLFLNGKPIQTATLQHGHRIAFSASDVSTASASLAGSTSSVPSSSSARLSGSSSSSGSSGSPLSQAKKDTSSDAILMTAPVASPQWEDVRTVLGKHRTSAPPPASAHLPPPPGLAGAAVPPPLSSRQERILEILLAVGKALSQPEEITAKIERIVGLLFDVMEIDRAAILVLNPEAQAKLPPALETTDVFSLFQWSVYRHRSGGSEAVRVSSTVIRKVLVEKITVLTQDAQREDWLDSARSVFGQAIRMCICTPLQTAQGTLGVLYADSARPTSVRWPREDLELFSAFAAQAAVALHNAHLLQAALQKERVSQDLEVARRIQRMLLPHHLPPIPGYEVAGESQSMDAVGGDYFDVLLIDPTHLALVVGDVSGHGVASSLVMTMTRSILRASLSPGRLPSEILQRANALLSEDMLPRMFVTLALAIVELPTGQIAWASAGHVPLLHLSSGGAISVLAQKAPPLGMSQWARLKPVYQTYQAHLAPGDLFFLYSDGLLEASDPQGELFEMERLQSALRLSAKAPAADLLKGIQRAVSAFCGKAAPTDDVTSLVIKRLP